MARKTSTKRRTDKPTGDSLENFFNQPSVIAATSDDNADPEKGKKEEPSMADLLARIEQLNSRVEESERTKAMLMAQTTPAVTTTLQPPKLSFDGLPDPAYEAEKYQAEMAKRTEAYVNQLREFEQAKQEQTNQSLADRKTKSDQLWADFQSQFEDYASDEDRVQFAAQKVAKRLQGRGVDVEKYMFSNSGQYLADIAKEMDEIFGKPGDDTLNVDLGKGGEEPTRTAGIPGGVGSRPVMGSPQPDGGDFTKEIQDVQRKMGIF